MGTIIDFLHSDEGNPNTLKYYNAFDLASLRASAGTIMTSLSGRREALVGFISDSQAAPISASEKTRKLWAERLSRMEDLLVVYANAGKEYSALTADEKTKREEFLATSHTLWQVKLRKLLTALDREMTGPFALGTHHLPLTATYFLITPVSK